MITKTATEIKTLLPKKKQFFAFFVGPKQQHYFFAFTLTSENLDLRAKLLIIRKYFKDYE